MFPSPQPVTQSHVQSVRVVTGAANTAPRLTLQDNQHMLVMMMTGILPVGDARFARLID